MAALSDNSSADSSMICKLTRQILHMSKPQESRENHSIPALSCQSANIVVENSNQRCRRKHITHTIKGGAFLCSHAISCMLNMPSQCTCTTPRDDLHELSSGIVLESNGTFDKRGSAFTSGSDEPDQDFLSREATSLIDGNGAEILEDDIVGFKNLEILEHADVTNSSHLNGSRNFISSEDHASLDHATSSLQVPIGETPEMFLPGLVVHILPEQRSLLPLWNCWKIQDWKHGYRAILANRENFKDIVVTPYMFLDHLPWRCHQAMLRVLETRRAKGRINANMLNGENVV